MTIILGIIAAALFLAYANGANDNFKGVATLYGSGVASFKTALAWATISTFSGSLAAAVFAEELLKLFTGKGLVPDWLVGDPTFLLAVILGAAVTVFIAAIRGIPISTTHALVGALTGAGLMAVGQELNFSKLGNRFFLPLAVGPLIPIIGISLLYPLIRWAVTLPWASDWIDGPQTLEVAASQVSVRRSGVDSHAQRERAATLVTSMVANERMISTGHALHFISAGAVGFARGLNDTPKIVGIAIAGQALQLEVSTFLVALAMALGGILQSHRIAETMSHNITALSPARGAFANVVTSLVVIFASRLGLPVSTTHVSVGAIMGIGVAEQNANWRLLTGIFSAWVLTLPIALSLAGAIYWAFNQTSLAM